MAFPGTGPMAVVSVVPTDFHYVTAGTALTGWNMPGRTLSNLPSELGFNLSIEQYFAQRWLACARYGYANQASLNGVNNARSASVGIDGLMGGRDNHTGLGFGYAQSAIHNARDETSLELFQRFQLANHVQFTTGAQAVINPTFAPHSGLAGVFSLGLQIDL